MAQRFRATVVFEYETGGDAEATLAAYGTDNPLLMAAVDESQAESDLGLFISLASGDQYDVTVEPIDG